MLWHYNPATASEAKQLTAIIAVADHLANHLQQTPSPDDYEPEKNPFVRVLAQLFDVKFENQFAHMAKVILESAHRDLLAMTQF